MGNPFVELDHHCPMFLFYHDLSHVRDSWYWLQKISVTLLYIPEYRVSSVNQMYTRYIDALGEYQFDI